MTDAPPSRGAVFRRGLGILLAWHVVLAGVPALLLYRANVDDDDCVAYECLLHDQRTLVLWLSVAFVGIPALVSLVVSVATCAVLVLRSDYPPALAAGVGAFAGFVVACCGGLVVYGLSG